MRFHSEQTARLEGAPGGKDLSIAGDAECAVRCARRSLPMTLGEERHFKGGIARGADELPRRRDRRKSSACLLLIEPMKLQRLCYIHIPKTAGTAVTEVLTRIYPVDKVFSGTLMYDYTSVEPRIFRNYLLYKGHIHYSFAVANLPGDTRFITVLRDPVERVLSLYFFVRKLSTKTLDALNLPDESMAGVNAARESGIVDYLQSSVPDIRATTRNHQLQALVDRESFQKIGTDPGYVVRKAWSNLEGFFCYGVQDFLPFFVDELSRKLGQSNLSIDKINQNKDKLRQLATLGQAELEHAKQIIRDYNQAEIALYNRAKAAVVSRMEAERQAS